MVNLKRFNPDGTRRYYLTDVCMAVFCGISVIFGALMFLAAEIKLAFIHPAMIISDLRYVTYEFFFLLKFLVQTGNHYPFLRTVLSDFYIVSSNSLRFGYRSLLYGNVWYKRYARWVDRYL
ncbi:hypothetical protein [Methanolapillus millepedarum]|uniref:Uncharacterized protein n=1 Tax=Methanolapillus millepedarum TaxID=3028296 RepID=A0AA96V3L7_9EURY|nr:hypothetical protein MsAc7_15460 [Methanosarcinaceae archaeon Ac7]